MIIFKGKLVLEKIPKICVYRKRCELEPTLVGTIQTKTGATNIAEVERMLWLLNGKKVKITIRILK